MKYIINCDRSEAHKVISQERYEWEKSILLQMGFDWEDCLPEEQETLTINQKAKFRKFLEMNKIYIYDFDGVMGIYLDKEKIAEWSKPRYTLQIDHSEVDPKKRLYNSIEINCWSCFDDIIIGEAEENDG